MENNFAERLRILRKNAGLTQEELAWKINANFVTVSKWENGEFLPKTLNIKKLAEALHVSENELLNGEPGKSWVLHVEIGEDKKEDYIDMSKSIAPKSVIITSANGGYIQLGGDYSLWTDDNLFKKIISDMKKLRASVIQNGKALGGIKD